MALVPLLGGDYQAKSIIANAQRCINLIPEKNQKDAPFPFTYYPRPGLVFTTTWDSGDVCVRQIYKASNGIAYAVVALYHPDDTDQSYSILTEIVSANGEPIGPFYSNILGQIPGVLTTPVNMSDNGLVLIIVDGTPNGYVLDLSTNNFAAIPATPQGPFYGADKVDYIDTFFVFNRPGTNQWYSSLSEVTFEMLTSVFGSIMNGEISAGGTSYTDGTYNNVYLTGGSGSLAIATITVSGGIVINVVITAAGNNYVAGDSLSASSAVIGSGGSGFAYEVLGIGGAFDPLYIATKNGAPDNITTLIVMHREIWLVGVWTTEVWYDAGAADFPFQVMPGAFIEHGCAAKYSLAAQDLCVYFLSQDRQGNCLVLKGSEYQVKRISTHAIENEFQSYIKIDDAIGFTFQIEGHVFYYLTFPTANKTWLYDEATECWSQWASLDPNGNLQRFRANCGTFATGGLYFGDYANGNIYQLSLPNNDSRFVFYYDDLPKVNLGSNDAISPIRCIRSFPHLINDYKRVVYTQFIADMQAGTYDYEITTGFPGHPILDGSRVGEQQVTLRWSDDRGRTFNSGITQTLGQPGQYLTNLQWRRLGMARDRVFEISFQTATAGMLPTALNGAYIQTEVAET